MDEQGPAGYAGMQERNAQTVETGTCGHLDVSRRDKESQHTDSSRHNLAVDAKNKKKGFFRYIDVKRQASKSKILLTVEEE